MVLFYCKVKKKPLPIESIPKLLFRGGESSIVRNVKKKPMVFFGYLRKAKKEKGLVNFAPLYLGKGLSFRPVANNFAHKNNAVDIVINLLANMEETMASQRYVRTLQISVVPLLSNPQAGLLGLLSNRDGRGEGYLLSFPPI